MKKSFELLHTACGRMNRAMREWRKGNLDENPMDKHRQILVIPSEILALHEASKRQMPPYGNLHATFQYKGHEVQTCQNSDGIWFVFVEGYSWGQYQFSQEFHLDANLTQFYYRNEREFDKIGSYRGNNWWNIKASKWIEDEQKQNARHKMPFVVRWNKIHKAMQDEYKAKLRKKEEINRRQRERYAEKKKEMQFFANLALTALKPIRRIKANGN